MPVQQTKLSRLIQNLKKRIVSRRKNLALNTGGKFSSTVASNLVERNFACV